MSLRKFLVRLIHATSQDFTAALVLSTQRGHAALGICHGTQCPKHWASRFGFDGNVTNASICAAYSLLLF